MDGETGLRWGINVATSEDGEAEPLSVARIDAMTTGRDPETLSDTENEILEAIRLRAREVVDSGIVIPLTQFRLLSRFEMLMIAEATDRRRAIDLFGFARASGHAMPELFLPNSDIECARVKARAEHLLFCRGLSGGSG